MLRINHIQSKLNGKCPKGPLQLLDGSSSVEPQVEWQLAWCGQSQTFNSTLKWRPFGHVNNTGSPKLHWQNLLQSQFGRKYTVVGSLSGGQFPMHPFGYWWSARIVIQKLMNTIPQATKILSQKWRQFNNLTLTYIL